MGLFIVVVSAALILYVVVRRSRTPRKRKQQIEFSVSSRSSYPENRLPTRQASAKPLRKPGVLEDARNEILPVIRRGRPNIAVVLDVETNGFKATESVLSFSAIKCRLDPDTLMLVELGRFDRYYYPKEPYNPKAIAVNGLDKATITARREGSNYPQSFREDLESVEAFCSDATLFVSHNMDFDRRFLPFIRDRRTLCTMKANTNVVRTGWLESKRQFKWPKLDEAAAFYQIPLTESELHGSLYDAEVSASIFGEMLRRVAENTYRDSVCPNCTERLERYPLRKTHCKACGTRILVRKQDGIHTLIADGAGKAEQSLGPKSFLER